MGNHCCSTENVTHYQLEVPNINQLQQTQLPKSDPIIIDWFSKNTNQQVNREQKIKRFYKLRDKDVYYYSELKDQLPSGKGFIYKPGILFYNGYFNNGIPEGESLVKLIDKQCEYIGFVKGEQAHGHGTLIDHKNKYKIQGNWKNSKPIQAMITFFQDSNINNIQMKDFVRGNGSISYKDNRWYEGQIEMKKLLPHGSGKVTFPFDSSNKYYKGQWYMGQMSGKGQFMYADNTYYLGQFLNGKRHGFGKFVFDDNTYYEGYWKNGKQSGPGTIFENNRNVIKMGMWQQGKFVQQLKKQEMKQSRIKYNKIDIPQLAESDKKSYKIYTQIL